MKRVLLGVGLMAALSLPAVALADSVPLKQGIQQFNKGYIQEAIPLLEKATQVEPRNEKAHLWLARAYKKQGTPEDFQKAKEAYRQVLAINPNHQESLVDLAEILSWDTSARHEAVSLLSRVMGLEPDNQAVAKKLAQLLYWEGRPKEALRYAELVGEQDQNAEWLITYGEILSYAGEPVRAARIFQSLDVLSTGKPHQKVAYASALAKAGQRELAAQVFDQVKPEIQALSGEHIDTRMALSALAFDLQKYADVVELDEAMPASARHQKEVQLRLARAYAKSYRVPEAMEAFHRVFQSGQMVGAEKLEYADYLRSLGLTPDVLPTPMLLEELYQSALTDVPGEASLRLARYYGAMPERFSDAVQYYQQALPYAGANRRELQQEMLDFIKAHKADPALADQTLQALLAQSPNDPMIKGAYAEFLSWQDDRRPEALRLFLELAQSDVQYREYWKSQLEKVLLWHQPTTDLIPLYQEIANQFPDNKILWLSVARAYHKNPEYFKEALETYQNLMARYPDDSAIREEWIGVLMSDASRRKEIIQQLQTLLTEHPDNHDARAAYGKLLSYERKYDEAMAAFDTVLKQDPVHKEALLGKGYTLLWSGHKLKAKEHFEALRKQYPNDVDIAIGLAQAEKVIGRYDRALDILKEIRPLMNQSRKEVRAFIPVDYRPDPMTPSFAFPVVQDVSVLPHRKTPVKSTPQEPVKPTVAAPESAKPEVLKADLDEMESLLQSLEAAQAEAQQTLHSEEAMVPVVEARLPAAQVPLEARQQSLADMQSDLKALNQAIESLEALQNSSKAQLQKMQTMITQAQDGVVGEMSIQQPEPLGGYGNTYAASGEGGLTFGKRLALYSAIDYDTNPLLSGLGRLRNDDLEEMEKGLANDLSPMLRVGYMFFRQDGEPSTYRFNYWSIPNQLSVSLTPQIRARFGINPYKLYNPSSAAPDPDSTTALEYAFGATVKYWDRLTLDGDMSITNYNQSDSVNINYHASARYDINDSARLTLGSRRYPMLNSLLNVAGIEPDEGFWEGDLVGQVRENAFYGELSLNPFNQNIDWNLGYEWAFVTGHETPTNYKNQAYTSLGYTHHFNQNHRIRAGYEFLYFGYSKNATNGFFDITDAGIRQPVVKFNPVTLADSGYVFGGYFSPKWFILNAFRLDYRGSLFNKFMEYKIGGSLGVQAYGLGHGIDEDSPTSLASSFDANVILNWTDWLATYGSVDFLDTAGAFQRWRFGAGVILRPHIEMLSPVFK